MPPQLNGRRNVLLGLATVVATLAFAAPSFGVANVVTIDAGTSGRLSDPGANRPQNRTEDRTPIFNYTVAATHANGDDIECSMDDAVTFFHCGDTSGAPAAYSSSYQWPTPLSLGAHTFRIRSDATGPVTSYSFRVEPPQYGPLVLLNSGTVYGYWKLDDLASADTANDSGPNNYDGDYKNFPVKRQPALVTCENQPHPPYACDWEWDAAFGDPLPNTDPDTGQPNYSGVDGASLALGDHRGRDAQGWGAYFGGRDDHIQIEDMPNPGTPTWSVEAWVRPTFTGETRGIFTHVPNLWAEPGSAPNTMRFACAAMNDRPNKVVSADIADATFAAVAAKFHVVCTYQSGTYRLYVNNVLTQSNTANHTAATQSGGYQGFIGLVNGISDIWWKGYIDNVAYYASRLSDDDVKYHYETGTITEAKYIANASGGTNDDLAPPSVGDITRPGNNSQYSADADAYKGSNLTSIYACTDPSGTVPTPVAGFARVDPDANGAPYTAVANGNPFVNLGVLANDSTNWFELQCEEPGTTYRWYHRHTFYKHGSPNGFAKLLTCLSPTPPASANCPTLMAWYRLNESLGATTILDETSNNYDGEYKNDQDQGGIGVSGDGNRTREFFGLGGYAAINNIAAPLWGYTLEGWWKPADDGSMMIMQHGSNGAIWYDSSDDTVRFRPDERGGYASFSLPDPQSTAPNSWYYVAGTYDGITGKLYVQESVSPNVSLPSPATVSSHYQDGAGSADTFYLGYGDQLGGNGWLRGQLDEVLYYDSALSAAKLTDHFNADPPAGDVAYSAPSTSTPTATPAATGKTVDAKAKAKAKARKKAKAKARAKALAKAKARAKAKAKARAKAKAKRARAKKRH